MNPNKREQLSKRGWKVGTVAEFLQLTPAEATSVELKLIHRQPLPPLLPLTSQRLVIFPSKRRVGKYLPTHFHSF